ncbi:MAG: DsbA family protein [Pseudomonadota bacterium]
MSIFAGSAVAHELDKDEVQQLVIETILENPDVVLDAIRLVQDREQRQLFQQASGGANALVIGDPNAPITIVEFFDYNCGFCKRAATVLRDVLEDNPDVKIVLREFPILNEGSIYAARAALAAREQGRYEDFHWAMMDIRQANEASVLQTAEGLGLDMDQLKADMQLETVESHLLLTRYLAEGLEISGTPAFLIGDKVVRGYKSAEEFAELIAAQRG